MKKDFENISWNLLAKDVSGELTPEEHLALQKELASNPDLENQLRKLWGDARYAQEVQSINTNDAWDSVMAQIANNRASKKHTFQWKYLAAASVAIVLAITLVFSLISDKKSFTKVASTNAVEQVILPDGTVVDLNVGSQLEFPKSFDGETRLVKLQGEAFFDVVRNEEKPFVIETDQLDVRVLGTSFNVKAYKDDVMSEVTVSSGMVRVDAKQGDQKIILEAGDAADFNASAKILEKRSVASTNYKSWKTLEIEFDDTPLNEIIDVIEQTYHVNIQVDASVLTSEKVLKATFSKYSLEHVLESVCSSFNLTYKVEGGVYIIENM